MESFIDYYSILGVSSSSTICEIKSAYRALAKKFHPDVCKEANAHERFVLINEAYLILVNEQSKREYDRLYEFHFPRQGKKVNEGYDTNADLKQSSDQFKQTTDNARQKAEKLANLSLEKLLKLLNEASKDASEQILNVILYIIAGFLLYQVTNIFIMKNPNYLKMTLCLIACTPIFWYLFKRKFV